MALRKNFKVHVNAGASVIRKPAVPAKPGYFTTISVVEYGALPAPQQPVPESVPVTAPPAPTPESKVIVDPNRNRGYRWATWDEMCILLIGRAFDKQRTYFNHYLNKRVPLFSMCQIMLQYLTLAVNTKMLHEKIPYQRELRGTSDIALAWYTYDTGTSISFCIGEFPAPEPNPLNKDAPAYWQASSVYKCSEVNGEPVLSFR